MTLFVTRHVHTDETCPAVDPKMGNMLLQHLSKENAAKAGINIHGEAVVESHNFYMIMDAPSIETVQEFMGPFAQAGSVEIFEGSSCGAVVARGSCGFGGKIWRGGRAI